MTVFLAWCVGIMILPAMIGLVFIVQIIRPQRSPADASNRINKIRLVWMAMTREDLFTGLFSWLKKDEFDNMKE